ncbi:hypothetical protein F8S13_12365 [Chloroflexia bacterium SDU3-3]|nr:hypothetical protein F8S13_12365 [Chloroflexia bacterium SDU3-3]
MDRRHSLLRRAPMVVLILAILIGALPTRAQAQTPARYFSQTGHYLKGVFRTYWESKGGVAIFGLPITEEYIRRADGKLVQYFERARFELRVQNNQGFVDLGRLGAEVTGIQQPSGAMGGAFKAYWQRYGGTAIFGVPLTNEYGEVQSDGRTHTVQWTERAKFELWGSEVRLSLLGRLLAPPQLLAAWPADTQPGAPLDEDGVPLPTGAGSDSYGSTSAAARVVPASGAPGQVFTIQGEGFQAGEPVTLWLTSPDMKVRSIKRKPTASGAGSITGSQVSFTSGDFSNGRWAISARGEKSGRVAIGYFTVIGAVGDPNKLGEMLHTTLQPMGRGSIAPLAAVPGSAFVFSAAGFDPNEEVGVWLTKPNGAGLESVSDGAVQRDGGGGMRVVVKPQANLQGVWLATAQGKNTKRAVTALFKLTSDFYAPIGTPRPANRNGSVSPAEGGQSTQFNLGGSGFRASEQAELWVTTPDGSYYLMGNVQANKSGRIAYTVKFTLQNALGVYGYHYRGLSSGNRVDLYMTFNGTP